MPTLGFLVDERSELQLKFVGGSAPYVDVKVAALAIASQEDLLNGRINVKNPPEALTLLTLTGEGIDDSVAAAVDRVLPALAKYRASGLVITVPAHSASAIPEATRAAAHRARVPILTTTAQPAAWAGLHEGIRTCRVQHAEKQVENLAGLVGRLPGQWTDPTALASITAWLATALEAQVLVHEPERGVLAAAPDTAAEHLAPMVGRQTPVAGAVQAHVDRAGVHYRLVSVAPTRLGHAILAVAADRPFDEADNRLIQHAAKVLGLVDQAQRDYATVAQTAREARSFTYQLLLNGEHVKARRFMGSLFGGRACLDEARIYVIDCGSERQREAALRRCELATTGRAIVVPCPSQEQHLVLVEPSQNSDPADLGIATDLQRLVMSLAGARLGGSSRRPLAMAVTARQEALTALRFAEHTPQPFVLKASQTNLVDLLDPGPARAWGLRVLAPIRCGLPAKKAQQIEETLVVAFNHPHTKAAQNLDVHRNTVAYRVNRAAELLCLDLSRINNRVIVGLALDLATLPDTSDSQDTTGDGPGNLRALLAGPRLREWAHALLDPIRSDRRDLLATVRAWLDHEAHVDQAANALGLAEVTIRSHLKAVEQATGRSLTGSAGLRDITVALSVSSGSTLCRHPALAAA
ncbi:helix-turn-helix domain-containing protein [Streptomyces sp. NPDC005407]|uniref:helix-turn-helix domain-containing protein n=1 Tax=Streptomyces sp. NPDC005407 TaxID=3155340 RepID=UPI0033A5BD8D